MSMIRFEDSGTVTLTEDFPYEHIEQHVFHYRGQDLTPVEAALECQSRVWEWIYQPPNKHMDGFLCRCIVASWIFNPMLRGESMTDVAARFGKKKQSLGRWVASFKRNFPEVTNHLQHIRNK